MPMSDVEKLYVDASQPATLHHAGDSVNCVTLQEAVTAWYKLTPDARQHATIEVNMPGGPVYTAKDIDRLHYGPKPKA